VLPGAKAAPKAFASPAVADVLKGAGEDTSGRKVVIGNVKITFLPPPDERAQYDLDYHVLKPPVKNKIFRCHIRSATGAIGSVDIPPEAGKSGHVTGYNVIDSDFQPPFTVQVDEYDFAKGRDGAVQVSNSFVLR
jgi:hypothetical protein